NDYGIKLAPSQSDHAKSLGYSHSTRDYSISAGYTNIGKDFRADLGFMSQVDYEKIVIGGSQTWYGDDDDTLTRWGYYGDVDKTYDSEGKVLEEEAQISGNLQGPMQLYSEFGVIARNKLYDDDNYDETLGTFYANISPVSGVRVEAYARFGELIDYANKQLGDSLVFGGSLTWQIGTHLQFNGSFEANKMDVDDGELFSAQQSDIRLTYQFDMRSYIRLVVQYTDITRDQSLYDSDDVDARSKYMNTQLLYSYKINPQTLFFLGYSDRGRQDDDLSKILRTDRTVFAKFSYAWQM
ncbi:MAG: hydrolase, partial [Psychrosphaera sp.]|nr:hydrolase [Psychrosphaera sp.]